MTQEEIRRLLGGYATNTLSERERASLFEAALDDQGLFDALQSEDALRELLADPVSREQVRQALQPAATLPRRTFWTPQRWFVSAAGLAAAAAVAIGIVFWQKPPAREELARQTSSNQIAPAPVEPRIEPKAEAPQQAAELRRDSKKSLDALRTISPPQVPAPAPTAAGLPLPEPQQAQDQKDQAVNGFIAGAASQIGGPPPRKQELSSSIAANSPLYRGPLVRYSLLPAGKTNDETRLEVVSQVAGYLGLYRMDAAGQWQRIFPMNVPEMPIAANIAYQIPDSPIAIHGKQDKLRLVIDPTPGPAVAAQLASGSLNETRAKALSKSAAAQAPTPLVIEIPIGSN